MSDKGVSTLPQELRDTLLQAYTEHQDALRESDEVRLEKAHRVASLFLAARQAGWPNVAIGDTCGITGTSASRIMGRHGEGVQPATDVTFPQYGGGYSPQGQRRSTRAATRTLTQEERQELAEVAALARTCTGSRPLNHPTRIASKKFSAKIMEYHDAGVTWREIADAAGMKVSGVRMRAQRHGYNSGPPPSIPPYKDQVRTGSHHGASEEEAPKIVKAKRGKSAKKRASAKAPAHA